MNLPELKQLAVWNDTPQHPMLKQLKAYQAWRQGLDKRKLADTDLTPEVIGKAIEWAISELEKRQAAPVVELPDEPYSVQVYENQLVANLKKAGVRYL